MRLKLLASLSCLRTKLVLTISCCAFVLSGCVGQWSSSIPYSVVHVLSESCEPQYQDAPVLRTLRVRQEEHIPSFTVLSPLEDCGTPFEGTPTRAKHLQVWVTDKRRSVPTPAWVQAGHSEAAWLQFSVSETWLHIDHRHVWLGTLDITQEPPVWLPPSAVAAATERLTHRQACGRASVRSQNDSCGPEWNKADLFTFETAIEPPASQK